jgi:flagellar basal-body rod protein FlgF
MDVSSLYTSMAGLQELSSQLQATASNLANSQTTGYSSVQAAAVSAPYQGANAPSGADVVALVAGPSHIAGPLQHTGDPLDVGIHGDAWLQVQTPQGNALTRDGSLQVSNAGLLTDSAGNPIMSASGGPISVPSLASLSIAADGTISGVPAATPGAAAQSYGQIGLFATPAGGMTDLGGSKFAPPSNTPLQPATDGTLTQNYLNSSDVDPTQAMMTLIGDSRSYQSQTDLMKTQSSGSDSLNTVLAQG